MLRPTLTAAAMVLVTLLAGLVTAFLVDRDSIVEIYKARFDFHPGSWVGERIARTIDSSQACLIVGASTARQGFDPAILEAGITDTQFLNAGTTGAPIEVLELEAQIVARYGMHYKCIVAAVHPWLLKQVGLPELVDTEYASQLRLPDIIALSHYWWSAAEWKKLGIAYLVPLRKHAGQLNKMMRVALLDLRNRLSTQQWDRSRMEFYAGELTPAADFSYAGNPNYLEDSYQAYVKTLTEMGWYDRDLYVLELSLASFDRALMILSTHADKLLVVTMPDTTIWDEPNLWAKQAYESVIIRHGGVAYADCQLALSDDEFVDHAHPNDDGRRVMSEWLISEFSLILAGRDRVDCPATPRSRARR